MCVIYWVVCRQEKEQLRVMDALATHFSDPIFVLKVKHLLDKYFLISKDILFYRPG